MDYRRPIEALIPGVQGRILGALARTGAELTIRGVAELAGVSPQQAAVVTRRLVALGIATRRDVPPASLIRLADDHIGVELLRRLAGLRDLALDRLRQLATAITPAPASLIVFGSFARGEADDQSDIDVLAVRPPGTAGGAWTDSLGRWSDEAARALGNPINLIEAAAEEVPALLAGGTGSMWAAAAAEGIVIAGRALAELPAAA